MYSSPPTVRRAGQTIEVGEGGVGFDGQITPNAGDVGQAIEVGEGWVVEIRRHPQRW